MSGLLMSGLPLSGLPLEGHVMWPAGGSGAGLPRHSDRSRQ